MKYSIVFFSVFSFLFFACGSSSESGSQLEEPTQERPAEQPEPEKEKGKEPIGELIQIEQPLPNIEVSSPLQLKGKARGYWYFEGDFPIRLEDKDGNTLAEGYASAQGEWMTEDWVPFQGTLELPELPDDERGYLVFMRDNPSGLPENDRSFRLPVLFPPKD